MTWEKKSCQKRGIVGETSFGVAMTSVKCRLTSRNLTSSLVCLSRTVIQDSRRMESESGGVYVSFKTLWASPGAKVYGLKVKLNRPSSSPDINYPRIFVC